MGQTRHILSTTTCCSDKTIETLDAVNLPINPRHELDLYQAHPKACGVCRIFTICSARPCLTDNCRHDSANIDATGSPEQGTLYMRPWLAAEKGLASI